MDLLTQVIVQRSLNPEDVAQWQLVDFVVNLALFFLLGVLVVRDTGLIYAGVVAGVLASLLDAIVVAAAAIMAPAATPIAEVRDTFAENVAIGTVFAGLAGVVYGVVQRWSGGRRSR
jgi:hypothetical protein